MNETLRCCSGDSLSAHSGYQFTTQDADHDPRSDVNCAQFHQGAWWYNSHAMSNLNGVYLTGTTTNTNGTFWFTYNNTEFYSLKMAAMELAP